MPARFTVSMGWAELLRRTVRDTQADDGLGLAAQLAYYFFLALFPALLFLIALAGLVSSEESVTRVVAMLQGVAPQEVIRIIRDQLIQITQGSRAGLLTFGVVGALWSSSAALVAIINALNRAYDVEDSRSWWKRRLVAILLTIGAAVFILVSITLVLAGPDIARLVGSQVGLGATFVWSWQVLQWPLVFLLVAVAISLIYYFAPDVDQDFALLTPGSVVATMVWLAGSLGFRIYVANFGSYNETYGTIGGVIVLMLWLYLSGLAIILGAEVTAELERASPHWKPAAARQPGQRLVVGARAERAFRERAAVEPAPVPAATGARGRMRPAALARTGMLLSGVVAALASRRVRE